MPKIFISSIQFVTYENLRLKVFSETVPVSQTMVNMLKFLSPHFEKAQ